MNDRPIPKFNVGDTVIDAETLPGLVCTVVCVNYNPESRSYSYDLSWSEFRYYVHEQKLQNYYDA